MLEDKTLPYKEYPGPWNRRFVHYAMSKGETPDSQMILDKIRYPGGCMAGYVSWIAEMNNPFADEMGFDRVNAILWHQTEFDQWLQEKFPIQ